MERLFLVLIALFTVVLLAVPVINANSIEQSTICNIDRDEFPDKGEGITRHTCIVDGSTVFDQWVHGLAFAWVNASSERVFQVLTDYKNWRRNICHVERVRITQAEPNYRIVEWKVKNNSGSTTRYTNEYFLSPESEPKTVTFNYIGPGEIDDMEGEWVIFSSPALVNQVLIRYTLKLNPKIIFMDAVRNFVHENLECLLTDIRNWAETNSTITLTD